MFMLGDEYGLFHIDPKNGNVTVKGELDREYYSRFALRIKAYEVTNENSYATIYLHIKLRDSNDNQPHFQRDHYEIELTEDQLYAGMIISEDITATDDDLSVGILSNDNRTGN